MPDPPEAPPLSSDLIAKPAPTEPAPTPAPVVVRAPGARKRAGAILQGEGHQCCRRAHGAVQALALGDRRESEPLLRAIAGR